MNRRWTARFVTTAALMTSSRVVAGQAGGAVAISNGIGALTRRDLAGAVREFSRAGRDSSPAVRSSAEQWLGHLSWLISADTQAAAEHLDRALAAAKDSSPILVERARLLAFQRRYHDATRVAAEVLRNSTEAERRGLAARTLVDVATDGAFAAIEARGPIADSVDAPRLREALDTLSTRVARFPGRTIDAMRMLNAGAMLRDGEAVRAAATSYFLLRHDSLPAAMPPPTDDFVGLATGLAGRGLYEAATLLLESQQQRRHDRLPASATDLIVYGTFVHQLRAATNEFYRRALLGLVREGDLDRTINARTRSLWPALSWPAKRPAFYPAAVPGELAKRFNARITIEREPSAIPELHLGHVLESYASPVPAGLSRKPARITVLDGFVSNGVDFWLLDGAGGRAGWVSGDSIFEVRTAFTETPFRAWMGLVDTTLASYHLRPLQEVDATDVARARADSIAYLPGVAARLFRSAAAAIFDSLSDSLSSGQRQRAFVNEAFRQLTETSIGFHESRHLVDAHLPNRRSYGRDAEFRAKVDEVAYASRPKLAMTAIFHPNIGDATPHGQANRRIMLALLRWIRSHTADIRGFDPSLPALVQLPLLTDVQLRAAFQSMRPPD